jgi:lipopolysaccharide/colanic/teichoic acid biosynthesis glycosyltransferase
MLFCGRDGRRLSVIEGNHAKWSSGIRFATRFTNREHDQGSGTMSFYTGGSTGKPSNLNISSTAVLPAGYAGRVTEFEPDRADVVTGSVLWKRALDVALSLAALVLLSPVMLAAAVAVKMTSPGPVIFSQERVGLNRRVGYRRRATRGLNGADRRGKDRRVLVGFGKPFKMYKFRTMVANAEKGNPVWAQKNDSRITRVGALLRRTRIDELPQFANVLKGDMSIVGPRPERAYFIAQIEKDLPEFQNRLRTKPGITGLAQVELGYTNTVEGMYDKLGFDLTYIRDLTPLADLRILFKTISVVFTGKGAY